ncbi:hypothetical protein U9M48_038152 [Paspalum notatum var. saurae]|uniref:UBA domain-containing protein n=1 Tax=Paspalum notatum var. saurae TaxID=547442 RepID=A0AAQ3ULB3_PASNO
MYADRSSGRKRSVMDRLGVGGVSRLRSDDAKRFRRDDGTWRRELYKDSGGTQTSSGPTSRNVQSNQKSQVPQRIEVLKKSSVPDLREKLSGVPSQRPRPQLSSAVRIPKPVKEVAKREKPVEKREPPPAPPPPAIKNISAPAPVTAPSAPKQSQEKVDVSLDSLLKSLDLEKYLINFQAEEARLIYVVDMKALVYMNEEDMKALGIPMGPRKKILSALAHRKKKSSKSLPTKYLIIGCQFMKLGYRSLYPVIPVLVAPAYCDCNCGDRDMIIEVHGCCFSCSFPLRVSPVWSLLAVADHILIKLRSEIQPKAAESCRAPEGLIADADDATGGSGCSSIPPSPRLRNGGGVAREVGRGLESRGYRRCGAMAVPQVDKKMLGELEVMGFPTVRSIRALHFSGNSNLESAVNWLLEHESDPDIDQLPLVPREIRIECGDTSSEVRNDVQGMRDTVQEQKPEEQTETGSQHETSQLEREQNADEQEEEDRKRILALYKQKRDEEGRARGQIQNQLQDDQRERIRAAKDLMEAKRTLEENQRKRMMESRIADKEEEKRARERIRQRIADDRAERRRRLGLSQEKPEASVGVITPTKVKTVERVVTSEQLRDCLRTLKKNHKDDNARVTRAYQILLKIVANIGRNPAEEKFRRIRLSNPIFKDRVGNLQGGIEFLELCGFQRLNSIGYLVMPRDKVDMALLNAAGVEVASAMENPYFGLLSK